MSEFVSLAFQCTLQHEPHILEDLSLRRMPGGSTAYYPDAIAPEEIMKTWLSADWEEVIDIDGDRLCRSFRAPIPGITHVLHLTQLPTDSILCLMSRDPTNTAVKSELVVMGLDPGYLVTSFSTMLVGNDDMSDSLPIIWDIHPGPPRPTRVFAERKRHGELVTFDEARALGMNWARVM